MNITIRKATTPHELEDVFEVRRKVFVVEQNCPPELEYCDEEVSTHFLALCDDIPAGTARWRKTEKGYKLERFAVLSEFRGKQVGAALVRAVLADLPPGALPVYLHAQLTAKKFYEHFGFRAVGEHFEEAGIMHQRMLLETSD